MVRYNQNALSSGMQSPTHRQTRAETPTPNHDNGLDWDGRKGKQVENIARVMSLSSLMLLSDG